MIFSKPGWTALLVLLASQPAACVDPYPVPSQYCVLACQFSLATQLFVGIGKTADVQRCNNALYVESTAICAARYCTPSEIDAGSRFLDTVCEDSDEDRPLVADAIRQLDPSQIDSAKVLVAGSKNSTQNTTIIPDLGLFNQALRSAAFRGDNRATNYKYSDALYIFWGIVLGIGTISNILPRIPLPESLSRLSHLLNPVRAHLVLPATIPTFGTRIFALTLLAYLIVNIILCAVEINAYPQSLYYATFDLQLWGLVARRLATLGLANIPIIWIFGIRNNVLIYLTGWEFSTFNRFHRWIARIATLQLLLHGICFTAFEFAKGGSARYLSMYTNSWWNMGIAAVVLLCFNTVLVSALWLRNRYYDAFLLMHVILGVAVLVTVYYHVEMWHGIFTPYVWAAVGIWAFDRAARLLRIASLLKIGSHGKGRVEYDATADLLRIDVSSLFAGSVIKPVPGAYYYIYTPTRLLGWESHPFTLTASATSIPSADKPPSQPTGSEKTVAISSSSSCSTASSPTSQTPDTSTAYEFLIRPRRGFTARLKPALSPSSANSHARTRLLLEGPYGAHHGAPVHGHAHVLVLCGGSGISVGVAAIHNALYSCSSSSSSSDACTGAKVRLVWAVRSGALLESVVARELAGALSVGQDSHAEGGVVLDAYITGAAAFGANAKQAVAAAHSDKYVRGHARPDLSGIIHAEAGALEGGDRLAVVVCGPADMIDEVRATVAALVGRGMAVDLFAEHFGW